MKGLRCMYWLGSICFGSLIFFFFLMLRRPPSSPLFPYTPLFRSGLDVKVLSPPHVVLIAGIIAIDLGALILILGSMNRAEGRLRSRLNWIFLYIAAMILV